MRKSLTVRFCLPLCLALGLVTGGCDDDPDPAPVDGGRDGGDGGVLDGGGRDTPGGEVNLDARLGGDGPDVNSEVGGAETSSETGLDLGPQVPVGPATWTSCADPKNGISPADFCAQYGTACGFDPAGGSAGAERYKSLEDCVAKYTVGSAARRGCVAYHLCLASQDAASKTLHCPHPPQASLPVPVGPGPCGNM